MHCEHVDLGPHELLYIHDQRISMCVCVFVSLSSTFPNSNSHCVCAFTAPSHVILISVCVCVYTQFSPLKRFTGDLFNAYLMAAPDQINAPEF